MTHPEQRPILSVIIPVLNGARYLEETISSILNQRLAALEMIILLDDGSVDNSAEVAESLISTLPEDASTPKVRSVRHKTMGLAAARNLGHHLAQAPLLLHLDADDVLTPNSLSVRLGVLDQNPDAGMVIGHYETFISPDIPPEKAAQYAVPASAQQGGLPGTSIVRASFAEQVGPHNTDLDHSADLDWMIRAYETNQGTIILPDVVLRRRVHGNNNSLIFNGSTSRLRILRSALERRARIGEAQQN